MATNLVAEALIVRLIASMIIQGICGVHASADLHRPGIVLCLAGLSLFSVVPFPDAGCRNPTTKVIGNFANQ